jgi:hypothetical protein
MAEGASISGWRRSRRSRSADAARRAADHAGRLIVHDGLVDRGDPGPGSDRRGTDLGRQEPRRATPCRRTRSTRCWCARRWPGAMSCASRAATRSSSGAAARRLEACRAAGVPVEVVPGISAASARRRRRKCPLTHRGSCLDRQLRCRSVQGPGRAGLDRPCRQGPHPRHLHGPRHRRRDRRKADRDGLSPAMPVAVIENAHTRGHARAARAAGRSGEAGRARKGRKAPR